MEHKHTPGPWVTNAHQEVWSTKPMRFNLTTAGIPMIASVCRHEDAEGGFPAEANARLIAAAPDLLQALRVAYSDIQRCQGHTIDMLGRIEAAIAKATGATHE